MKKEYENALFGYGKKEDITTTVSKKDAQEEIEKTFQYH